MNGPMRMNDADRCLLPLIVFHMDGSDEFVVCIVPKTGTSYFVHVSSISLFDFFLD